ncbi:galactose-3-O-sulfotransferase 2-like [Branchiostoma floridae x Branchiostoma belcheri]
MELGGLRTIKTYLGALVLLSGTVCLILQSVGLRSGTIWQGLRKGRDEIYSSMTRGLGHNTLNSLNFSTRYDLRSSDANGSIACTRHDNIAFIKVYKCGSSTLQSFFLRYAHKHDLLPALPGKGDRPNIGCGAVIKDENVFRLPGDPKWNIFAHHFIFNKTVFDHYMHPDTRFVTILRDPIARLNSVFDYFNMWRYFRNMPKTAPNGQPPIMMYLQDPSGWDKAFKGRRARCYAGRCVKNCMAKDLGYNKLDTAAEFVNKIEKQFSTILILEHLNHSLVLLKRRMCWSLSDIIYDLGKRERERTKNTSLPITDEMKEKYRKSSAVDHELYDHFNRSLWQQVQLGGSDFLQELSHFQQVLEDVFVFCHEPKQTRQKDKILNISASQWNEPFVISRRTCYLLTFQRHNWDLVLRRRLRKHFKIKKHQS